MSTLPPSLAKDVVVSNGLKEALWRQRVRLSQGPRRAGSISKRDMMTADSKIAASDRDLDRIMAHGIEVEKRWTMFPS
jgi:hypothetical protein